MAVLLIWAVKEGEYIMVTEVVVKNKSGLVTAGLVLGIIGVLLSAVPIINNFAAILGVLAAIFGLVGVLQSREGKRSGRGISITVLILGIVTVGIVIASQAMYSATIDSVGKSVGDSIDKSSGNKTDELLKTDVDVTLAVFVAEDQGYGMFNTSLEVTTKNKTTEKHSFTVKVEALDETGARIADDTLYVNDLAAGQSQKDKAFTYVDSALVPKLQVAKFKVYSVGEN